MGLQETQVRESMGTVRTFPALMPELEGLVRQFGHAINFILLQWTQTTFAQFIANTNDLDIADARLAFFSSDASRNLTGLTPGIEGRILPFVNTGSFDIVLMNQDTNSAAANRVICRGGADITYAGGDTGLLWYDLDASRWRQFIAAVLLVKTVVSVRLGVL